MSENEPVTSAPDPPNAPLDIGDVIAEKYRVEAILGEGAMGCVFAAEHTQLGHKVALKVLRVGALAHKEAVERFLREGRAVARLQSEHIARVTDVGTLRSGVPYLVMEFLEGTDLSHVIKSKREITIEESVDFVLQTCEALAHAHSRGIVHRDLKPANLFVTTQADGSAHIKVLDFGISKYNANSMGSSEVNEITMTAALMGTPKYMSPEQIHDSRAVDNRADIWALGTILYELTTGSRPFVGGTVAMTCVKILQEDPAPPRTLRAEIAEGLEQVILRCLRKDPNDRYANVGELAEALAPFGPPNAIVAAMKVVRIVQNPPDLKNSGMRGALQSTGSFAAVTTPSRINVTPTPNVPALMRASSSSSSPGSRSPGSSSNSAARPHVASDSMAPDQRAEEEASRKKRGAIFVAIGAALAVIVVVLLATRGPKSTAPETTEMPKPSATTAPVAAATATAPKIATTTPTVVEPVPVVASASASASVESAPTQPTHYYGGRSPHATTTATAAPSASAPPPVATTPPPPVPTAATPPPKPTGDPLDDRR